MHVVFIFFLLFNLLGNFQEIHIPSIEIEASDHGDKQSTFKKEVSIIVEVEGNAEKHGKYIETYYPFIEVISTYTTLFQGIALKGPPQKLKKLANLQFITGIYPVQTYTTLKNRPLKSFSKKPNITIPSSVNDTIYTGKGVKIGVIDTGMDYTHPDLRKNYVGGFDLVDLDDDPMETTGEQGMATSHGTHVAGIIAADGDVKGVAPDGEIYAYRALGPGGVGTSIQVIAAMEEAVKDGVDVINLSLGNTVNGPDYPTSKAANKASKKGVALVVANGNDGPTNWTVGAPATANSVLSVGAYQGAGTVPYLYEPKNEQKIQLSSLNGVPTWNLKRDYKITSDKQKVRGKIGFLNQKRESVVDEALMMQKKGAVAIVIHYTDPKKNEWISHLRDAAITIPIALVSKKDGRWLHKHIQKEALYFKSKVGQTDETIANFSSRGPVTLNWMIKPDISAPGVNVLSTVPGGYDVLNGTSMAAPHVAGAIAVLKEARPNWTNEQIFGALQTTAKQIKQTKNRFMQPISQGAGLIRLDKAIHTDIIIKNPLLSFGKIEQHVTKRVIHVPIENVSEKQKRFHFNIPKKEKGLSWKLTQSFTIDRKEKKEVPIEVTINTLQLEKGTYEGHLTLESGDETYYLPYAFVNKTADYKKVMGFSFHLNKLHKKMYEYELYVAEPVESVRVQLFDPQSLVYEGELMMLDNLEVGMNEGEINERNIKKTGKFYGLIIVQLKNGEFVNYDTEIYIE